MADEVKVLEKALDVLELLSGGQEFMTAQQISQEVRLPKSTVHRLLNTLTARGYVRKDQRNRTYAIGLKVLQLKERTRSDMNLIEIARPILRSLADATTCTAHLAILSVDSVGYIDHWMSANGVAIRTRLGEHAPLYCTSLGKVLLAGLPDPRVESVLQAMKIEPLTPHTIVSAGQLQEELETVRQQGYAEDREESALGIHCIGAPIRDDGAAVVAAISITAVKAQIDEAWRTASIRLVKEHADKLSASLGYLPPNPAKEANR